MNFSDAIQALKTFDAPGGHGAAVWYAKFTLSAKLILAADGKHLTATMTGNARYTPAQQIGLELIPAYLHVGPDDPETTKYITVVAPESSVSVNWQLSFKLSLPGGYLAMAYTQKSGVYSEVGTLYFNEKGLSSYPVQLPQSHLPADSNFFALLYGSIKSASYTLDFEVKPPTIGKLPTDPPPH